MFDGTATAPYTETDPPNPQSAYAASKLLGEWFAADAPRAYVLRVESLFGRAAGGAAVEGQRRVDREDAAGRRGGARVRGSDGVADLRHRRRGRHAAALEKNAPAGLYHCVNSGHCTWLEFARELARQLGVEPRLVPVRMADMTLRAPRPLYCALSNAKIAAAGAPMPSWQDAVRRFAAECKRSRTVAIRLQRGR